MNDRWVYTSHVDDSEWLRTARLTRAVLDVFDVVKAESMLDGAGGVLRIRPFFSVPDETITFVGEVEWTHLEISHRDTQETFDRLCRLASENGSGWVTLSLPSPETKGCGGIVADDSVLVFRGLSAHLNEAILCVAARLCQTINLEQYNGFIRASNNPLTEKLWAAVAQRMAARLRPAGTSSREAS